jgi:hypothetical protein
LYARFAVAELLELCFARVLAEAVADAIGQDGM